MDRGIDFAISCQLEALAGEFRLQEMAALLVERDASRPTVAYAMTMISPAALEDFAAALELTEVGLHDIPF